MSNFKREIRNITFYYIFLTILFGILQIKLFPSIYHIGLQIIICVFTIILYKYALNYNVTKKDLLLKLLVCLVFTVFMWRGFNTQIYNNPLGYNPIDALAYHSWGTNYSNSQKSITDIITTLQISNKSLDDYGYFIILTSIYSLFGTQIGINILLLLNVVAIIGTCNFIYKICDYLMIEKKQKQVLCVLIGMLPYAIYTASCGLKENFMLFLITTSVYNIFMFLETKFMRYLFVGILLILLILLFRIPLSFILLLTLIVSIFINISCVKKYIKAWTWVILGLSLLLLSTAVTLVVSFRGKMALNQGMLDSSNLGNSSFYTFFNLISLLIGPIPSFVADSDKINYITLWNFGSFLKMMFSGGYIYGIYIIYKKRLVQYYPILIFIFLHSVMLYITMFSAHDRFQMPQIPFVFMISFLGYTYIFKEKGRLMRNIMNCYPIIMMIIIYIFNSR